MAKMHKVEIETDMNGFGKVTIDGQEVPNVTRILFETRGHYPSEVTITLAYVDVEIRTETGEIVFKRE